MARTEPSASERRWMWARIVLSLLVLAGAYVGLCWWSAGHVPATATVGGASIGGLPTDRARQVVQDRADELLARPITLASPNGDGSVEVIPREIGLTLRVDESIAPMTGFSLDPRTVWGKLTGSVNLPLLTGYDDATLTQAVTLRGVPLERPAVEGRVTFPDGAVEVVLPVTGRRVDVVATKFALRRAFPDSTTAIAGFSDIEPKVSAGAIREAADTFGRTAMSAPITIVADKQRVTLAPKDFAPAVSLRPDGSGRMEPVFDDELLRRLVSDRAKITTRPAKDATWVIQSPGPKLVPSVNGIAVDESGVAEVMRAAISGSGSARTAVIPLAVTTPNFTTENAVAAGVREMIVDFASPFPPEDTTRTQNLVVATKAINGTYVAPGESFSLNGILGQRTTAKGYADGTVIINGKLTRGTGGGISQVSTVVYNLAYFAGADILEFTPHAFFIPRYPEGREATVYWPTVDNRWKNDTPYGMLLQTWVEGGNVRGRVWSTKVWDIKSIKGPRRNVVEPKTIRTNSLKCYPQSPNPGFDVTVVRQWYRKGSATLVKSESTSTHYIPEDRIICTNPNATPP